jgi:hypothetical protein
MNLVLSSFNLVPKFSHQIMLPRGRLDTVKTRIHQVRRGPVKQCHEGHEHSLQPLSGRAAGNTQKFESLFICVHTQ